MFRSPTQNEERGSKVTPVSLTRKDLALLRDLALHRWLDANCSKRLPECPDQILSPEEFTALAWFYAVNHLLQARGFPTGSTPHLVEPDGTPTE
jgi:hypothetical protein